MSGRSSFSKVQSSLLGVTGQLKEGVHSVSIKFWSLASLSPLPRRGMRSGVSDLALDKASRAAMKVEMKDLFMLGDKVELRDVQYYCY
jgi:hypothetical protein